MFITKVTKCPGVTTDAMLQKQYAVDSATTATFYEVRKKLYSDIFQITPLLDKLFTKGKVKERAPKGSYFEIPFGYAKLTGNQKWFGRGEEFAEGEQEFMTRLQYYVKNFGDNIVRYWKDEIDNQSPAQILDYIEEVINNHKMSMMETLHLSLWSSGGPQAINTLPELISTTPTTGTVGGLDRSKNTYLQNNVASMSGRATNTYLLADMENMFNTCSNYKGTAQRTPDMIVTTQTIFEEYQDQARALGNIDLTGRGYGDVDLGFGGAKFKGADMFYDPNCPAGTMYMLNSDTLEFPYDPNVWMQMTEWKYKHNSLDRYAQVITRCNLVCNNFKKNGVIHSITVA